MDLYKFDSIIESNFKFEFIDATYVLTLKDSPRISTVTTQLHKTPLSKLTYIVENPGYKKIDKPLPRQDTEADIAYSHYIICKHAIENSYNTILVLEDDFVLEEELEHPSVARDIKHFLSQKVDTYFLGCTPFVSIPASFNLKHWYVPYGGTAHAMIHQSSGIQKLVEFYEKNALTIKGIDLVIFKINRCYMYYDPLITQTFPKTENSQLWADSLTQYIINLTDLANKTRPGYDYIYIVSKIGYLLILFIVIQIFLWIRKI